MVKHLENPSVSCAGEVDCVTASHAPGAGPGALMLHHVLLIGKAASVLEAGWMLWLCLEVPVEQGHCPGQLCCVQGVLRPNAPDHPELILVFSWKLVFASLWP